MYRSIRDWVVLGTVMAAFVLAGCTQGEPQNQNWDWFAQNQAAEPDPLNPQARSAPGPRGSYEGRRTAARDPRAEEVDSSVDRYVQSMNSPYRSNYESNDFNSKIRRQQDPDRSGRIQQTATRQRSNPADESGDMADARTPRTRAQTRKPATIPPHEPAPQQQRRIRDDVVSRDVEEYREPQRPRYQPVRQKPIEEDPIEEPIMEPAGDATHEPIEPIDPIDQEPEPIIVESSKASGGREPAPPIRKQRTMPPVLADIEISPAPAPATASPVDTTDSTGANSSPNARANAPQSIQAEPVDTMATRIAEQEAKVAKDPNNIEEQFRLRLLYVCDGQDEKALETTSGINADVLEIMRAQIQALLIARSNTQRDPALWANRQMEAIEGLRDLLKARADIEVTKVVICRSITSFGVYDPIDPPNFKANQRNAMFLYVPIKNFKTQQTPSGMFRTLLSIRYSVLDDQGKELWSDKIDNIEDIAREHRHDFYLGVGPDGGFVLPPRWGPGEYTVKVEVEDMLAQKINSNTTKFKIVP